MSSLRTATDIINELHAEKHTLLARLRSLESLVAEATPYIKTVSRSGWGTYDERSPDLYERMREAVNHD